MRGSGLLQLADELADVPQEEDIALFQIGDDGRKITGLLALRSLYLSCVYSEFLRERAGQRALAVPVVLNEQNVANRTFACMCSSRREAELFLDGFLANDPGESRTSGNLLGSIRVMSSPVPRLIRSVSLSPGVLLLAEFLLETVALVPSRNSRLQPGS